MCGFTTRLSLQPLIRSIIDKQKCSNVNTNSLRSTTNVPRNTFISRNSAKENKVYSSNSNNNTKSKDRKIMWKVIKYQLCLNYFGHKWNQFSSSKLLGTAYKGTHKFLDQHCLRIPRHYSCYLYNQTMEDKRCHF